MARNSGRNLRHRAPFLELEMSFLMPERLKISEAPFPDARATRKTVFKVRSLNVRNLLSLIFGDLRKLSTTAKSHLGERTLVLRLMLADSFMTAETMGSLKLWLCLLWLPELS